MAFWRVSANFASLNAVSGINRLLEKPESCSLTDLLEEDDILQELREHNARLIEYLREPRILRQLLRYVAHWTPPRPDDSVAGADDGEGDGAANKEPGQEDHDAESETGSASDADEQAAAPGNEEKEDDDEEDEEEDDDDEDQDLGLTRIAASPDPDSSSAFDEEKAWRYARLATEVFSSEIWSIYETVMRETELLEEFWTFLDNPAPLDPVYAGYFTKTNEQFLERKTDQMVEFLKTQPNLVERFMRHIDTPSTMDLLLKILCTDKPDSPTGIIDYLQVQRLIPSLIGFLSADTPSNSQSAAGDFLKALITISANATNDYTSIGPNELTRELVSPEIITKLADQMVLSGGTALATAVGVIIELIRKNNSDYDAEPMMSMTLESHPPSPRDPVYLGHLLKILAQNIPRFEALLTKKHTEKLDTSFGTIEPLGFERFKICELVAELLHCSNMALLNDPRSEAVALERDTVRRQLLKEHDDAANQAAAAGGDEDEDEDDDEADDFRSRNSEPVGKVISVDESEDEGDDTQLVPKRSNSPSEQTEDLNVDEIPDGGEDLVVGDFLKYQLIKFSVVSTITDLFFKFPWNNFLHNVVFDIIQQIFNGPFDHGYNRYLAIELFKTDRITDQIVAGTKASNEHEAKTRMRLGYMGHLTLISEEIVKFLQRYRPETLGPSVVAVTVENENWNHYVNETLMQIRIRDNSILGGQRPSSDMPAQDLLAICGMIGGSGSGDDGDGDAEIAAGYDNEDGNERDEDDEEEAGGLGKNSDQKWSRYMSQQMTPDRFGSSDEDDEDEEIEEQEDDEEEEDDDEEDEDDDDDGIDEIAPQDRYIDDDSMGVELARTSSHEL
ncbi:SIT4 phosphatase-associated protein-domain-containing protein [Myxozyma melibiosi]|uniref:SIT4 phosphatase-associated protein-domain-containing protein n=1 Tax=Myxozyma melibiosi TaxID=54550 RepID=A0ABR1EYK1_9ASCO